VFLERRNMNTEHGSFKSVFVPIHTYGHESWVVTEKILSRASGENGISVESTV